MYQERAPKKQSLIPTGQAGVEVGWARRGEIRIFLDFMTFYGGQHFLRILGRVRLGSIQNKNNWLFCSRSRIAGIYSGIYSYAGISQTNAPLVDKYFKKNAKFCNLKGIQTD